MSLIWGHAVICDRLASTVAAMKAAISSDQASSLDALESAHRKALQASVTDVSRRVGMRRRTMKVLC